MTKVSVYGRRRQRRQQQRRRGYDNSSLDFRHGELKIFAAKICMTGVCTGNSNRFCIKGLQELRPVTLNAFSADSSHGKKGKNYDT